MWLMRLCVFCFQIYRLRLHLREDEWQSRIQDGLELPVRVSHQQEEGKKLCCFFPALCEFDTHINRMRLGQIPTSEKICLYCQVCVSVCVSWHRNTKKCYLPFCFHASDRSSWFLLGRNCRLFVFVWHKDNEEGISFVLFCFGPLLCAMCENRVLIFWQKQTQCRAVATKQETQRARKLAGPLSRPIGRHMLPSLIEKSTVWNIFCQMVARRFECPN